MKSRTLHVLLSFLLILALAACGRTTPATTTGGGGGVIPTATESGQRGSRAPEYFTEDFDGDLSNWTYEFSSGREEDTNIRIENGDAIFTYKAENIQTYTLYDPYSYDNVKVEITVQNRGVNNHYISLVCRWTDFGHYEAVITGGGLFWLYAFSGNSSGELKSGGSGSIKAGKVQNTYTLVCNNNVITLYANGTEIARVTDNTFGLTEGQVGFGIGSQTTLPVDIAVKSFTISKP